MPAGAGAGAGAGTGAKLGFGAKIESGSKSEFVTAESLALSSANASQNALWVMKLSFLYQSKKTIILVHKFSKIRNSMA